MHFSERQLHPGKDSVGVLYLQVRCPTAVSDVGPRGCGHAAENCGEVSRVSGCTQSLCAGSYRARINLANHMFFHLTSSSNSSQVLQEMQQFSKAEEHFDIAIKLEPQNPVHRVYKGLVSFISPICIS